MSKGAFEEACEAIVDDLFNSIAADIEGKPYVSKIKFTPTKWYEFKVLEDHTFEDHSMEFNNGILEDPKPVRHFKKGELISLRERHSQFFMPDRSKLEFIREYEK